MSPDLPQEKQVLNENLKKEYVIFVELMEKNNKWVLEIIIIIDSSLTKRQFWLRVLICVFEYGIAIYILHWLFYSRVSVYLQTLTYDYDVITCIAFLANILSFLDTGPGQSSHEGKYHNCTISTDSDPSNSPMFDYDYIIL